MSSFSPTVLHHIDTIGTGGAETVFVELATRLRDHGFRSVAVVPEKGWVADALRSRGLAPITVGFSRSWDLSHLLGLRSIIEDRGVDLVQTHLLGSSLYGGLAAMLRGVPVVATFHGEWDLRQPGIFPGLKYWVLDQVVETPVFVSDPLRGKFAAETSLGRRGGRVIPNGVDVARFSPGDDGGFRREIGVSEDHFLIGMVGNIRPAKDHESFLRLAAGLRRLDDSYRFVVVGDRPSSRYEDLLSLRDSLDLEDSLVFTGYRDDVDRVMRSLDLFVLTSSTEGFSLTTAEAMASGVPVLVTRSGGPETLVTHGVSGLLVDVGNVDGMVREVEGIRQDPELRGRMVRNARRTVTRKFSVENMVDEYADLYRRLLGIDRHVG